MGLHRPEPFGPENVSAGIDRLCADVGAQHRNEKPFAYELSSYRMDVSGMRGPSDQ